VVNDEAFTLQYRGPNLKGLLCGLLKCEKQKVRFWTVTFGPDEPLPKRNTMKLTKPIKPGFRRPFEITPDEAVDQTDSGTYVKVEIVAGDSTVTIDPASTATSIKGWLNGDGATGDKAVRFTADGHIGDGDQPVSLDVEYTVATPDATILGFKEGADEPIPT
jgi:hypothetical protein